MKVREITDYLNSIFLPVYQETYDNAGFLVGDPAREVSGVLATTDVTDAVIDEAIALGANLIVSHHPLIFGGLKRLTPDSATPRMVIRLIENGIGVYAAHTNLDNLQQGVNGILARKLGLEGCRILRPVEGVLRKLVTYVPTADADRVRQALFDAGAGGIGAYDCCSYNSDGFGTFRASEGCHPHCGQIGELHREAETRIEVIYEKRLERKLIRALVEAHPYEEPAYDCIPLDNALPTVGAGMVGRLREPMAAADFFAMVKERLGLPVVRISQMGFGNSKFIIEKQQGKNQKSATENSQLADHQPQFTISKVALCGGSGAFLIGDAKSCGADVYLTADLKYHDFQSAEGRILLADIGHFESEQFAKEIFYDAISKKFSNFACHISQKDRGYICYI